MGMTFRYGRKHYFDDTQSTIIEFNGKRVSAVYPANPMAEWASLFGSNYSPLFYEDQTPILGSYRKGLGRSMAISQLLYDIKNNRLVTEFFCGIAKGKSKMYYLQEIVPTRISDSVIFLQ